MHKFIKIIKHPISSAYLNLDTRTFEEIVINVDHISSFVFDKNYPNGYGDHIPELTIEMDKSTIQLYNEDAEKAYKLLDNSIVIIDKEGEK